MPSRGIYSDVTLPYLKTLHAFAPLSSEFIPFLACHHSITNFEINAFLNHSSIFHVSVPNIYGTSSSPYLIIFLKVISKVLFFNITQKFTNLLVQLSIFLIDLFVGTHRLSSHARLEAFVIQTKLN